MDLPVNKILCGDCLEVMTSFPNESINCCISSPPYWALRDYGVAGQLGLEPTFEEYIDKLCSYYDEVKRVLRRDGTCWVNLGDTYWGGKGQSGNTADDPDTRRAAGKTFQRQEYKLQTNLRPQDVSGAYAAKSLCCIPDRFRIEMINRGWILRNKIIWSKPNPMPSSAKDRFTVDFEDVMFFVKSQRYFFEPQYEPYILPMNRWGGIYTDGNVEGSKYLKEDIDPAQLTQRPRSMRPNPLGRNKRTTWIIPTQATPDAHFATFPEELVRPMVKAGCPRHVCKKCGKPRVKIWDTDYKFLRKSDIKQQPKQQARPDPFGFRGAVANAQHHFKGYTDCGCNAGWTPGVVLDPFAARAGPARWRPRKAAIISELILKSSMSSNLRNRMSKKLKAA